MDLVFSPCVILSSTAENPKKRKSSWFRDAAEKEASTGGVYIDAAHGVGAPKMEALAKVKMTLAGAEACAIDRARCSSTLIRKEAARCVLWRIKLRALMTRDLTFVYAYSDLSVLCALPPDREWPSPHSSMALGPPLLCAGCLWKRLIPYT